jgi:hypothetical protein
VSAIVYIYRVAAKSRTRRIEKKGDVLAEEGTLFLRFHSEVAWPQCQDLPAKEE